MHDFHYAASRAKEASIDSSLDNKGWSKHRTFGFRQLLYIRVLHMHHDAHIWYLCEWLHKYLWEWLP